MRETHHQNFISKPCFTAIALLGLIALLGRAALSQGGDPDLAPMADATGLIQTASTTGHVDRTNPFFQSLGTTGTTCEHCHFSSDAWGVSAAHLRALFDATGGTHPVFRPHSANNPVTAAALLSDPNATVAQRRAVYSLLLDQGLALVRIKLALPSEGAEFRLAGVNDPFVPIAHHFTINSVDGPVTVGDPGEYLAYTGGQVWLHRRPLPTTNFKFLTAVLWDSRNTLGANPFTSPTVADGVLKVAVDTIKGREAPSNLTDAQITALAQSMVNLQNTLFVAQVFDNKAGALTDRGALGGPVNLMGQTFHFGINDFILGDVTVNADGSLNHLGPFSPNAFTIYNAWQFGRRPFVSLLQRNRLAVARGQALFNTPRLQLDDDVTGFIAPQATIVLPDGTTIPGPQPFVASCSTCHETPNVGNHSTRLPIYEGTTDVNPAGLGHGAVENLPAYYFENLTTHQVVSTTDPGRAATTGKWEQVLGQFKVPTLRGLAARAPYFHNGMARTLGDVVTFYNARFSAHFTGQEQADLVAFLQSL